MITTMKVNQNIRSVAVNFLKGEFRVPRPQIESPAQLEAYAARVEATRLLGSQAVTRRRKGKKERRIVTTKRIRRKIDRRRATLLSAPFIGAFSSKERRLRSDNRAGKPEEMLSPGEGNDEKEDDSIVVEALGN